MSSTTTIFTAQKIHTMNPARPYGTAVAVRDGRILGVGTVEELRGWGEATIDDRFAKHILLPGFVEVHAHTSEGGLWVFPYVGYFDRNDPSGKTWKAVRSVDDLVARLKETDAKLSDPTTPLIAWGFDPIYLRGTRLNKTDLDRVSTTRPIFVLHASLHVGTVNSAMLAAYNITKATDVEGVIKGSDGEPSGELQELQAVGLLKGIMQTLIGEFMSPRAIRDTARGARNGGVTTFGELGTLPLGDPKVIAMCEQVTADPSFPARFVPFANPFMGLPSDPAAGAELVAGLRAHNTDKLWLGNVKFVLDGSIQAFTAKMLWPGYYHGADNGIWNVPPEQLPEMVLAYHAKGLLVHAHCNGNLTIDVFVDAVDYALEHHPRWDHRHTVQHCQLTSNAQYRRMKALGMCGNIFTNHIYYWGDQHYAITVGPDRADTMNDPAMAQRHGVPFSFHSDAGVTPLGGLHLAWCAVNRLTATGRVLGAGERISVYDALEAVTIGGAYQLKRDAEIGSIEVGKFADFAVLEADPFDVDPAKLHEIPVWGTVVGGIAYEAEKGMD